MDPFIAQIVMFGGNFAPRGWALCEGQTLSISSNTALFSLLGTIYGGDGRTTFMLPDLRGRFPLQQGSGPGLQTHVLGAKGGNYQAVLTANNLPDHAHTVQVPCNAEGSDADDPSGKIPGVANENIYASTTDSHMQLFNSGSVGGGQAVQIQNPFLALNYIICIVGSYPSRN